MIEGRPSQSLTNGHKSPQRDTSKVSADSTEDGVARENNLYVKNLAPDVDDARLERMFNAHGSVLSCRVLYDHANRSKQVAFVQMETHQQAVRSVEALHGMQGAPGGKALHVALAQNKQDRQRKARQASRARVMNGDASSDRSWQTVRPRPGVQGAPSTPPRPGRPQSSFNPYAGSFFPAGAGPYYVAHFVPYTPASYAMHQPPPPGFAYPGVPAPGQVLGMMSPTNGHASQHMAPMSPYPQPVPMPSPYLPTNGPPGHGTGTWSPRGGTCWPVQNHYGRKVNHAEPVPAYGQQQQMMVPMTPQPHYPQQWRM
ncbi:g2887 [Coccomyxa viridis]|uniref:G2887 protein n=1 Tax=Coccomyxa viridis TaxID=1274662 RepID=A0ABP1FN52_9CHLO